MLIINLSQDKSKLNNFLSNTLLSNIDQAIKNDKKTILYLNKRGDFSSLVCENCQHLYKCDFCDTSLTVHNNPSRLLCHICGFNPSFPNKCTKCNKDSLKKIGIGTAQIEDSLNTYFPKSNIFRFDLDNLKNITDKKNALDNLEKADIIIGTKMITTGFDFKNIGVIGIILLEQELAISKYNTEENAYINIKQLIGRGERLGEKTNIIMQTFIPDSEIVKLISEKNYKDYFIQTLNERKLFNYPPFVEMITLTYRDKDKKKAFNYIEKLYNKLKEINSDNEIILNPISFKSHNTYHYKIIIKGNKLRKFLSGLKGEIIKNSNLNINFE